MPFSKNILFNGDCNDIMKNIESSSIDIVITDPPYGVTENSGSWEESNEVIKPQGAYERVKGFKKLPRNKPFAMLEFFVPVWKECLRVLKPGSFAFVMSSPRQDVLCKQIQAIEEAGFTTGFPSIIWAHPNGFPKFIDIGKKIPELKGCYSGYSPKPSFEMIIVAMKPIVKSTYIKQVVENGKGVTWLDDCAIPYGENDKRFSPNLLVSGGAIGEYSDYFSLDSWWDVFLATVPDSIKANLPFICLPKPSKPERKGLGHPTQKPLSLMAYLAILGSRKGDVILDPFCGSGTTCLAAKMLEREYVGIELSGEYFKMAGARLEKDHGYSLCVNCGQKTMVNHEMCEDCDNEWEIMNEI